MPFDARRTPYGFGKNYWTTLCHENNNAWGPMHESNGNKHEIELPVYEDAPNVPDIPSTVSTVVSTDKIVAEQPVAEIFRHTPRVFCSGLKFGLTNCENSLTLFQYSCKCSHLQGLCSLPCFCTTKVFCTSLPHPERFSFEISNIVNCNQITDWVTAKK